MLALLFALMIPVQDSMVTGVTIIREPVPVTRTVIVRDTTPVAVELRIVSDSLGERLNAELAAAILAQCECQGSGLPWWFLSGVLGLGTWGLYELHRWIDKPSGDIEFNDGDVTVNNPPHEHKHEGHGRKGKGKGHHGGE
jgi:hypothetical protein